MTDTRPLPEWTIDAVSAPAMKTWCEFLRDENPIHLDPTAAEALGFGPHPVNPGPANLSYVINMVMAAMPDRAFSEIEARFLGNVLAGDTLHANGAATPGVAGSYDAQLMRGDTLLVAARIALRDKQ
ncbi:MaoC/PaaZ C-terminal domain-containing protein [Polymorphobacter sp.]|uniref:MaoC/PaaZ C-terminal domain-containing protein n=1 Tax=Polymorphobacter sp. TaxID=1909290 RepID=UPI003F6F8CF3